MHTLYTRDLPFSSSFESLKSEILFCVRLAAKNVSRASRMAC